MRILFILFLNFSTLFLVSQQDDILVKLERKDSLESINAQKIYEKNIVTNEVRGLLFRNIYQSRVNNEEIEFQREIERMMPFDNKMIDTIYYIQKNIFGENVYDTSRKSSQLESFLSNKTHVNTKLKVIENRYLLFKKGDIFSPYRAFENARLIRNSGIFHDIRIEPKIIDSQHIALIYIIQDVYAYGLNFSFSNFSNFRWGLDHNNFMGWTHKINTEIAYNKLDARQTIGLGFKYTIPNIIKKTFLDAFIQARNFSNEDRLELGISRQFSRPEFRWAGGLIGKIEDRWFQKINGAEENAQYLQSEAWVSYALPFRSRNTTINAIVYGVKFETKEHIKRPILQSNFDYRFWNSQFILGSIGYSKIKYKQERLLNGFGRTEDIPTGISFNTLYGRDFNEFNSRNYYGGQILAQYYTFQGYYINLSTKLGFYSRENSTDQGVFDFNLQNASKSYKIGAFRWRNYINIRSTIGINHDSTSFITLNDYNGIRGADNFAFRGNSRFTVSYQGNLFIPISFLGFRYSIFGLIELAKIQPSFNNFFETPLKSGASFGLSFRNENLIFDAFQIQYGFYPSTDQLGQKGFSISTLIPFRFQSLDISKPETVRYE